MSLRKLAVLSLFFLLFVCAFSNSSTHEEYAAGKKSSAVTQEVRSRHLSDFESWIIGIYKGHRVLYAAIVTLVMAGMGVTLAFLADLILKALGLEVSRISHRE